MKITVEKVFDQETKLARGISVSVDLSFLSDADVVICKIMKAVNDRLTCSDVKLYADVELSEARTTVDVSDHLVVKVYSLVKEISATAYSMITSIGFMARCYQKELKSILVECRKE